MLRTFLKATYGPAWLKRMVYIACGAPLGAVGFVFALTLLPSVALSITPLGLVLLAAIVPGARGIALVHRWLTGRLLDVAIASPAPFQHRGTLLERLHAGLTDGAGWRALLYLVLKWPLSIAAFVLTFATFAEGLVWAASPTWYGPEATNGLNVIAVDGFRFDTWPRVLLLGALGFIVAMASPWVSRVLVWPDVQLQRLLLGPTQADRLRRTRAVAVDDSAARLRRIERDLHDGAQAQLVAVAMKLSLAKEEMRSGEPDAGYELVDTAHADAQRALIELRDLARGIHPPALDQGLEAALLNLAARSSLPVQLKTALPHRASAAIESIVYHTAAELLTNATKHAHASNVRITLTPSEPGRLRLVVYDDGTGGAATTPGGGLAGLADRISTVDGHLHITSPRGGPTTIVADLPVRA